MKKIIILLLCCGVLIGMVGCGGNTASPSTESSDSIALEISMTETPHTSAVEPTEKEKEIVSIESQKQASESTPTTPATTVKPTEEIKPSEATNTPEEKLDSQVEEIVINITSQHTGSETIVTEPTKEITLEPETPQSEFDINYWITFAKECAVSIGLTLESEAVSCWDDPIGAGTHCIYLERDIKSRLNRYAKDADITDVWIWAEPVGDDCYDIYIGYA
jgi:hypothetical protein